MRSKGTSSAVSASPRLINLITKTTNNGGLIRLLGLLTAFGPMRIDLYLPTFPAIAQEFGVTIALVQYTLGAYVGGLSLEQLLYGPLADQYGRKPNLRDLPLAGCAVPPESVHTGVAA